MPQTTLPNRTDRRRERTRRQLLDAARRLIGRDGVNGLRIADLTDTADVGRGSFYNHFASREELVDAVAGEMLEQVAQLAAKDLADDLDPAERAAVANRRFVRMAFADPEAARLVVSLAHGDAVFRAAVTPYAWAEVQRGVEAGRFRVPDAEMTLLVLTSSAFAVVGSILAGSASPDAAERHAETMLCLFGLEPAEARAIARRPLPPPPA